MALTTFSGPVASPGGFIGPINASGTGGGPVGLRSYPKASVPPATTAGQLIYVSDAATGATVCYSNGTNWLRVDTSAILS
jgi:hypothetical protein